MQICWVRVVREIASPAGAVNGRDEWRTSFAAIDCPARSCSAVIMVGKPQGCLSASFNFERRSSSRNWPQFEADFDRDLQSREPLQFLDFCDTILILRKWGVTNSRWNINIFAKVFPVKPPQIHPHIFEFAEWEWFQRSRNPLKIKDFWPSEPLCGNDLATFFHYSTLFKDKELTDFD